MRFFCLFPRWSVSIASSLVVLLLLPAPAFPDTAPLDPTAVHDRIVQLGVGHRVNIEERTGVVVSGRITTVGQQSFTLRLSGDPNPLLLKYEDVADFPRGGPHGRTIFLFSAIGAMTALGIWGFVHVHDLNQQNQLPATPAVP